jgi:hypothetical protein
MRRGAFRKRRCKSSTGWIVEALSSIEESSSSTMFFYHHFSWLVKEEPSSRNLNIDDFG